jgi:hypothetical protein
LSSGSKQVTIRPTSNDDVREYHLSEQITDQPYYEFFAPMYGSDEDFEMVGEKAKKIAGQLMDPRHEKTISRVTFRPFSVRVYKAPTADWATVESIIVIPALKSVLGDTFQTVQYGSAKYRQLSLA